MITEVYINGNLIDIEDEETVTASYGNISFGELQKRKGVKSNTWKAPFSIRNKMVFESCEVPGSYSVVPYRKAYIRVEVYGVPVFEGFCSVVEAREGYEIQSFAGASDFYSQIKSKKLSELDLSVFDHNWTEVRQKASWLNKSGDMYAWVNDGRTIVGVTIPPEYLMPNVFFHTVIRQIATDAGYTLEGDVLTDDRFLKHMIICTKYPMPVLYGGAISLSAILPDVTQGKLWLDFANIYGLQFDVDDEENIIRCDYIDDLLFNDPQDWSDKVDRSERIPTKYSLDIGQKSYLRFTTDEICDNNYEKEIIVDDENLEVEHDLYKSSFFLIQYLGDAVFTGGIYSSKMFTVKDGFLSVPRIWDSTDTYTIQPNFKQVVWWQGTFYIVKADSTDEEPPNATYWTPFNEAELWTAKVRPMYGMLVTDPASPVTVQLTDGVYPVTKIINGSRLDWTNTYNLHYKVFSRIIDRTKLIEPSIKLNYADINQLDFTKLKRIDGELYVLEEVVQFKLNKTDSTLCNLIRL